MRCTRYIASVLAESLTPFIHEVPPPLLPPPALNTKDLFKAKNPIDLVALCAVTRRPS